MTTTKVSRVKQFESNTLVGGDFKAFCENLAAYVICIFSTRLACQKKIFLPWLSILQSWFNAISWSSKLIDSEFWSGV